MTRTRNTSGRTPKKRRDTLVKAIEKQYKVDLGYRDDAKLSTVLKKEGMHSLSKLLKMAESTKK